MNIKSIAAAATCHLVLAASVSAGTDSAGPLTVYDQPSLKGTSAAIPETHTIYIDSNIPGGMNDKISSFRLEQGYMAVLSIHANGTFTVSGKGAGFDGTADECQFVYKAITGDCEITARLFDMVELKECTARAGIMIRDSLDANSSRAAMLMTREGVRFQYRTKAGAASDHVSDTKIGAPIWLRVVRSGGTVKGYTSADGSAWSLLGSQTVAMDSKVFLGMAVSQQDPENGYCSDAILTDLKINGND